MNQWLKEKSKQQNQVEKLQADHLHAVLMKMKRMISNIYSVVKKALNSSIRGLEVTL